MEDLDYFEIFEDEDKPPWWFRRLPKAIQYLIMIREIEKLLRDPTTSAKIRAFGEGMERSMHALQGKDE